MNKEDFLQCEYSLCYLEPHESLLEKAETFGIKFIKDKIPMLRTELRFNDHYYTNVPEDLLRLSIRGADDDGWECNIERNVWVNHVADLALRPEHYLLMLEYLDVDSEHFFINIYDYDDDDPDAKDVNRYHLYRTEHRFTYQDFMAMDSTKLLELIEA